MSLSDKDIKRLAQATAEQAKLNKELESTENYRKKISNYTAEQLQAEQSLYQTNSQNSLMVAEMLARTGKLAEADKMRQQATEEHLKFVAAVEAQALTMRSQELAVKEAIKAVEDAQAEGNPEKIKVAQAQLTTAQAQLEVHKERLKVLDQEKKAVETRLSNLEKQTEEYSKLTEMGKEMYKETKEGLGAMAELFGGIVDYQKTGIGRAMIYVQKLRQGQGALAGIKAGLKDVFNPANIGAMLFTKVAQSMVMMLLKVDSMGAEFAKATGTGREYVGMIEDVVRTGNNVGVSFEDASNSIKGLYNEMIGFTMLSKDVQKGLADQVAGFETLGIATEDVADMMNTFSKTMGTSASESIALTRNLAMMGSTIGISSQKMIKNFQNANKTLAVYGKGSLKIFTNLSAAAKAAGVEMETLLGIAGKFDTFEDAADSVGKLNAILGSQMSATKMLMMTEDERIETLIMQINASGQSFAQMDRFKQKAIANAAGITDMAEANRIFGMSMSQYRQYGKEMKDAETSQKKMEEAMKATVPVTEMFQRMMIEFSPKVVPLLDGIRVAIGGILDFLNKMNETFGSAFPIGIAVVGGLAVAYKVLSGAVAVGSGVKKIHSMLTKKDIVLSELDSKAKFQQKIMQQQLTIEQMKANAANKSGVGPMLAMGAAILMVGYGIYLAATGLSHFVSAFSQLNSEQLTAVGLALAGFAVTMLLLAGVLYVVGTAAAINAGPMLAFGAAVALIGFGVFLAASGMALLVTAIGSLGADGLKAAGAFMLISQGMAIMMLGAAGLAVALYFLIPVLASAGFFSFTASLGMTSLAIGIGLAAIAAVLLGGAFMVIAEGLGSILSNAGQATMAFMGMGMGLAAMAVGIAAMFVFISNPMGWFAIAGAMLVMSTALGIFVDGLKSIPEETLSAVSSLAESIAALNAMQAETTIIARVTSDLESFKETMDATLMSQVASLSTFNNVRSMNEVRAETQVQQQIQLPPVELNVTSELTTNIGDKKFAEHVHEASKTINWNNSDGAKKIYLSGYQQTT